MWRQTIFVGLVLAGCGPTKSPDAPPKASPTVSNPETRMHFEHQEFVLDLDPSWRRVPGDDPEQFAFESQVLDSKLTISVMAAAIPLEKRRRAADRVLELRKQAEQEVDSNRRVTYGDATVREHNDKESFEIAYAGYDNRGTIFRFTGYVTANKILSFYCETKTTDNERAKQIFADTFVKGFKFYDP
jgi:hypothetical protein